MQVVKEHPSSVFCTARRTVRCCTGATKATTRACFSTKCNPSASVWTSTRSHRRTCSPRLCLRPRRPMPPAYMPLPVHR